MKFLFIAPRFHTNFYYVVKTLIDHGHQVDFFVLYQGVSEMHDLVKPISLGYSSIFKWWNGWCNREGGKLIKTQYELRYGFPPVFYFLNLLIKSKANVLIIKDITTSYSILALFSGFLLRKRMIVFTQIPKYRKQRRSGSIKWLWRLFGVYAITPVLGDKIYKNENDNLIYLPFIVPVDKKPRSYFKSEGRITILCVGKFQERKNQLLLLQAVNKLKNNFSLKLLLIGQDDEVDYFSKIRTYIIKHKLESIVEILNNVPWNKMDDYYRNSDVFVLPSYNEAASYSLVEAMSYGLPVLCSNDNGTQFYINQNKNGFVFDSFKVEDLTEKLSQIVSDKNKLIEMGETSKYLIKSFHQPDYFYQKLMELIKTYE